MLIARSLVGIVLGIVARLWLSSLRVHVISDSRLAHVGEKAWILAFFHGTQWPILAWKRRRKTVVLVSLSADGTMQAAALRLQGLDIERGSSSRGGVRGLAAIVRKLRRGNYDAAFAVDGPKGPYGIVKEGVIAAARSCNAVVVPIGVSIERGLVLRKTWDRFGIAFPFSRVCVSLGPPIEAMWSSDTERERVRRNVEEAIARENSRAQHVFEAECKPDLDFLA